MYLIWVLIAMPLVGLICFDCLIGRAGEIPRTVTMTTIAARAFLEKVITHFTR